jgi:hypothetical protein
MALDRAGTEALYDRLADAIDRARGLGDEADELEALFLAKLAFAALRELGDGQRAADLIETALRYLDRAR